MPQTALLWLLLLLLAMALGGVLASAARDRRRRRESSRFPPGYVQGVQDLFSNQPDQAVASFMRMLELEPTTVEPHFAIASLFRRRGEVDRAIRIHQNLIARPSLTDEVRCRALEALAEDYLHAGLLDRAENVARSLLDTHPGSRRALQVLLNVYEQEKEWMQAIDVARSRQGREMVSRDVLAHYYCELAEQAIARGEPQTARKMLREALAAVPRFPRAELILGRIEQDGGNWRQAIRVYRRLVQNAPERLSEVIAPLLDCYRGLGGCAKELDGLRGAVLEQDAVMPVLLLADAYRDEVGEGAAALLLRDFLARTPSLRGMACLLALDADRQGFLDHPDGQTVHACLMRLAEATKTYRCRHCGFSGRQIHWQCPSCRRWGSVHAVQEHMPR